MRRLALLAACLLVASTHCRAQDSDESLALVINYPYQITGDGTTKIHVCLFKPDFTPAAGAVVRVGDREVGTADEHGVVIFDYQPGSETGHALEAKLTEGSKTWSVSKGFQSNARTESFRSDQIHVATDRGVYQPGDTIRVRLLAWQLLGEYTAIDGAEVSVHLEGAGGQVLGGRKLVTNAFGVAAGELPVAATLPEGNYELVVLYREAAERARLRIERFVPPVLRIEDDLSRYLTDVQEDLNLEAKVAASAGGSIGEASLRFAVRTAAGDEVFATDAAPGEGGRFTLALDAERLDAIRAGLTLEQPFQIVLRATDGFGRTSEVARDVVYTARPFRAVLEFDKDDYPPGEAVQLLAKVVDLDGKPAAGIDLVCAVAEINVEARATTDERGVATFTFEMGEASGTAVVTSPLMTAPVASRSLRLNDPKPMSSKVLEPPKRSGIATVLRVDFDLGYVPIEKVVHVDMTDISGGLVVADTIPVRRTDDGRWVAEGTVTSRTWGTMLVNLYCCAVTRETAEKDEPLSAANVGFITEGQHVTLYPDQEVEIRVHGLKPRVAPGEEVEFEIEARTRSGQEAAVGAALVDRAVLGLLDPYQVTPMDRFYNPQLKVISTGGAGVLTWPVVDRSWGEPWRDIAYTNWGWKEPGALHRGARRGEEGAGPADGPAEDPALKMESQDKEGDLGAAFGDDGDLAEGAPGGGGDRGRRGQAGQEAPPAPQKITIRTRFPDTALWEPLLVTAEGRVRVRATFPDAISTQRLSIVASDRVGGVGLAHVDVEVFQGLFVRADGPAAVTRGDRVRITGLVTNRSGAAVEATVALAAEGLAIEGDPTRVVEVEDGRSALVDWSVEATRSGRATFAVTARTDGATDREVRFLAVLPAGEPVVDVAAGELSSSAPFRRAFEIEDGATDHRIVLAVRFPHLVGALQGWQALEERSIGWWGPVGVASGALGDAALLEWALRRDPTDALVGRLRDRLTAAAQELVASQQPDGGWGWWFAPDASDSRGGYRSNLYSTVLVLRALTEIRRADLVVDSRSLQAAISHLMNARDGSGEWPVGRTFFWEVNAPEADRALTAEIFAALVEASRELGGDIPPGLADVRTRVAARLATRPEEPAEVAHAVRGLLAWAAWREDPALALHMAGSIDHLLSLRRDGHWEPHWYHAYGGMVELNATILELLATYDPDGREGVIREIATYLLATRRSWGAWHNELGTVTAVRALLRAGAGVRSEKASTVVATVDGREVARVEIDPADPFLSAAGLRHLDLTAGIGPGRHELEVRYDGDLTAPIVLETRRWGIERPAVAGRLSVERAAPDEAALGQPVDVRLTIGSTEPIALVEVEDRLPANAVADDASLAALRQAGRIAAYRIEADRVVLVLESVDGRVELDYRLTAVREGAAAHPGTRVRALRDPGEAVATTAGPGLTVED